MRVEPDSNLNENCKKLICKNDSEEGCSDAYLFPKDDTKTNACVKDTNFNVYFCLESNMC